MRKNQHRETRKEQLVEKEDHQEQDPGGQQEAGDRDWGAVVARTAKALQGERHSSQF